MMGLKQEEDDQAIHGGLLRAYLLGTLEFDAALELQSALAGRLAAAAGAWAALVLCEHPPLITVGRHGSPAHVRLGPDELAALRWPMRWAARGGGTLLHLPGQLAVYPVLPLAAVGLGVVAYLERLQTALRATLLDFGVRTDLRPGRPDVYVGNRVIAAVGIAVRGGVSQFGAALNIDPDLTLFRHVQTGGPEDGPMTSLARERGGPPRAALVRQRLLEHFVERFGFDETDVLFHPPGQPGHRRMG